MKKNTNTNVPDLFVEEGINIPRAFLFFALHGVEILVPIPGRKVMAAGTGSTIEEAAEAALRMRAKVMGES